MAENFISRDDAEQDLLAAAAFLAENIQSSDGRAEALKVIIPLYLAHGNVDLAAELANEIDEPFSRDKMLVEVAEKCAEMDDDEYALQLVDAVEDEGIRGHATERIALAKVGKGDLDKASEYAASMSHPDFVFASIAAARSGNGDEPAFASTLGMIDFTTARVAAHLQVAHARLAKGELERAVPSIQSAVDAAADIEHDEEKIRAFCDAGNLYIEAKRSDLAVSTFDRARAMAEELQSGYQNAFFGECARGFKIAGSEELGDQTLDLITDKTEMASALLGWARVDWELGRKEDALDALDEAFEILRSQKEIETRDSRSRNALLTNIAVQFAGFGNDERALETATFNPDPAEEMNALNQIAQVHALQGNDEKARETLELIHDDAQRLAALISVSDSYERAGRRDAAVAMLDEAVAFSDSVDQPASRSSAMNGLAQRFAAYDMPDRVREVSLQNLDLIASIRDESSQSAALATLAGVYREAEIKPTEDELVKVGKMLYRVR